MKQAQTCCICGKPALYNAGWKGFCKNHKLDAQQRMQNYLLRELATKHSSLARSMGTQ